MVKLSRLKVCIVINSSVMFYTRDSGGVVVVKLKRHMTFLC